MTRGVILRNELTKDLVKNRSSSDEHPLGQ